MTALRSITDHTQVGPTISLAHAWTKQGRAERAIAIYHEVLTADPASVEALLGLAHAYVLLQRYPEARTQLTRLGEQNPADRFLIQNVDAFEQLRPAQGKQDKRRLDFAGVPLPNDCDLLVYTDSAGTGSGVYQINRALVKALIDAGWNVACAQPFGHAPLHERVHAVDITLQDVYDPRRIEEPASAADEPAQVLAALRPRFIVFADGSPMSNLPAKALARQAGIPYVCIVHCVHRQWARVFAPLLPAIADAYACAEVVVAVSRVMQQELEALFGLPERKGVVIYNGRPAHFFAPRDEKVGARVRNELAVPPETPLCLTIGRLDQSKGYDYWLQAVKNFDAQNPDRPALFVWAGIGMGALQCRMTVEWKGLTHRIRLAGKRTDIPALLDAADLFVLPSVFEGMPLVVLEAMARGVPVLATAVSGTPEALGDCGMLLPDPGRDPDAMIAALTDHLQYLIDSPQARDVLGRRCVERARKLFTEERMVDEYIKLISPLMKKALLP